MQGIGLIGAQQVPGFWLQLISVVLSVIVGFFFLSIPGEGLLTLTPPCAVFPKRRSRRRGGRGLLVVFFLIEGMSKVIFALMIRPLPNWSWLLASRVVGVVLAFILWSSMPVAAVWLLAVLLGVQLIAEGVALGYLAWRVRTS